MTIWNKMDRADKIGALTAFASLVIWYVMKGKRYVSA